MDGYPKALRALAAFAPFLAGMAFALAIPVTAGAAAPAISGCPIFPADNVWNAPVDTLPVDPNSSAYISTIGASTGVHPDFGAGLWDGEPDGHSL